ncbi:MAG: histidine phosphatase family protein [Anaerolineaceae bacterium]|nr:histidine phosphatase family protein [Anaerolineaceae bacterium]
MIELWLARHGQTDWNLEGRYQGHSDPTLNAEGFAQAARLGELLNGTVFDAIFCSDLVRARQTAGVLAKSLGAPVYEDPALRESYFGEWEGHLHSEIKAKFFQRWEERKHNVHLSVAPGGETLQQVEARMNEAAGRMAARFPGGRLLVVAHGLSLSVLVRSQELKPLTEAYTTMLEHGAHQVIHWKDSNRSGEA